MIPLFKTKINTDEALLKIAEVLNSGMVGSGGVVEAFEKEVRSHVNSDFFIMTNMS